MQNSFLLNHDNGKSSGKACTSSARVAPHYYRSKTHRWRIQGVLGHRPYFKPSVAERISSQSGDRESAARIVPSVPLVHISSDRILDSGDHTKLPRAPRQRCARTARSSITAASYPRWAPRAWPDATRAQSIIGCAQSLAQCKKRLLVTTVTDTQAAFARCLILGMGMAEPPMAPDRGFAFGPTLIAPSAALPCSSRDGPASTQHGEARWAR